MLTVPSAAVMLYLPVLVSLYIFTSTCGFISQQGGWNIFSKNLGFLNIAASKMATQIL